MDTPILILRELDKEEILLVKKAAQNGTRIYAHTKLPFLESSIQIPDTLASDSSKRLMKRVVEFGHRKTSEGKTLLESTEVEGFYPFYVARSKAFRVSQKPAFHLDAIEWVKSQTSQDELIVYTDSSKLSQVGLSEKVSLRIKVERDPARGTFVNQLKYIVIFGLRSFVGITRSKNKHKRTSVLAYTPPPSVPLKSMEGIDIKGDPIFGYLAERVQRLDDLSILLVLKNYAKQDKYSIRQLFIRERGFKNALFFESYLLRALLSDDVRKGLRAYGTRCKKVFDQESKTATGIDKVIMQAFAQQLNQFGLMYWRHEASKLFLSENESRVLGAGNEHSITKYPMLSAAKALGLPTFGIQHGGISAQNIFYSFIEADKQFDPIPTRTFTWGSYVESRLCESSIYPKASLEITGQIRTDIIPLLLKQRAKKTNSKTTVLYASQPIYHLGKTRRQMFEDVFRFQKDHPDVHVIIKPHPREFSTLPWIKEIANSFEIEADIRTDDLYELLSISDVVVTYYSTAGAEAVYFDKELIVLDYEQKDIARYHQLGVAHMASSSESLAELVLSIVNKKHRDLSQAKEKFRSERVYKIDGKTVDRTIDAIRKLNDEG